MKLIMLNSLVGVEPKGKPAKSKEVFLHIPEVADALGEIKFLGIDYKGPLKIGMTVYYGDKRSGVRMQGADIQVMEATNIVAFMEEENAVPQETKIS